MTTEYNILLREARRVADLIARADFEHEEKTGTLFARLPEHALRPVAALLFRLAATCPEHVPFRAGDLVRRRISPTKADGSTAQWRAIEASLAGEGLPVSEIRTHEEKGCVLGSYWDTSLHFHPPGDDSGKKYMSFSAAYFEHVSKENS